MNTLNENDKQKEKNVNSDRECNKLQMNLIYLIKLYLYETYTKRSMPYNISIINTLLSCRKCHLVAKFNELLIIEDTSEFLLRFYNVNECKSRLKKVFHYYHTTSMLYPNYTPLPESRYMYKNILSKQKVIEAQQELEGLMNYRKKNKEQKMFLKDNLKEKVFDTQIYDEIMNQSNSILIRFFGFNNNQTIKNNKENSNAKEELPKCESEDKIYGIIKEIEKSENYNKIINKKDITSKILNTNKKFILNERFKLKSKNSIINDKVDCNDYSLGLSPLKRKKISITSILQKKSFKHSRNFMNSTYYSSLNSQMNSHSIITKQNKPNHRHTSSMPKISINQNSISKFKFFTTANVTGKNQQLRNTFTYTNLTGKLKVKDVKSLKRKNIDIKNSFNFNFHGNYNFSSHPITERSCKNKKILHIQQMDGFPKKINSKLNRNYRNYLLTERKNN